MESSYLVRMTRGTYVVSKDDAERVLRAVETKEPHVLVQCDAVGDGLYQAPLRLVTAHVMSVAENVAVQAASPPARRAPLRLLVNP